MNASAITLPRDWLSWNGGAAPPTRRTRGRSDGNFRFTILAGSVLTALVESCVLSAKLRGVGSRRRRPDRLSIPVSRQGRRRSVCLRRVNHRGWLSGTNGRRGWRSPGVIPSRIDFLLAIGGEQQYRKDRTRQHCYECRDSGSSATS